MINGHQQHYLHNRLVDVSVCAMNLYKFTIEINALFNDVQTHEMCQAKVHNQVLGNQCVKHFTVFPIILTSVSFLTFLALEVESAN